MSMLCLLVYAQKTIHGTVKDATGEPMIGVSIVAGSTNGTVTDIEGKFTLHKVTPPLFLMYLTWASFHSK